MGTRKCTSFMVVGFSMSPKELDAPEPSEVCPHCGKQTARKDAEVTRARVALAARLQWPLDELENRLGERLNVGNIGWWPGDGVFSSDFQGEREILGYIVGKATKGMDGYSCCDESKVSGVFDEMMHLAISMGLDKKGPRKSRLRLYQYEELED